VKTEQQGAKLKVSFLKDRQVWWGNYRSAKGLRYAAVNDLGGRYVHRVF
jgi:hypothetical protein